MAQAATPTITQNILRDGLILPRTPDPAAMVIFGASGDLTARKLMPALYNLALNRYLPSGFSVIGVADTALTEDEYRAHMEQAVQKVSRRQPVDRAVWQSAQALNQAIHTVFSEPQIYRIDHYLGKETVQNVLVFRFANGIFEPIWNRRYVDHVQITVAEDIGIERRGKYYESSGALRDIFQNHLLQLLSIAAMEPPPNFDADTVRDEKVKVLKSIHPVDVVNDVVRGQYGPGWVGGQQVPGYRQEQNVSPNPMTANYVALRAKSGNWRCAH